jgi:hypothetical protein
MLNQKTLNDTLQNLTDALNRVGSNFRTVDWNPTNWKRQTMLYAGSSLLTSILVGAGITYWLRRNNRTIQVVERTPEVLAQRTKQELYELAKNEEVEGRSRMTKEQLIEVLAAEYLNGKAEETI